MRPKTNCKPVEEKKKHRQTKSANLNDSRGDLCFYGCLLLVMGLILATLETEGNWRPFLESPGNFWGPKPNIQIEI